MSYAFVAFAAFALSHFVNGKDDYRVGAGILAFCSALAAIAAAKSGL